MKTILILIIISFMHPVIWNEGVIGQEDNWMHFRGTKLDGIANVENVPVEWDDNTNIRWKTPVHGRGWSSPVVFGNQVWVTTGTADGRQLNAVCLDFENGDIIYDIPVFTHDRSIRKHSINTFATPTPCIEENFIYVHFGSLGTACINTDDGALVWLRTDLECEHVQGPGSSAFLYRDNLILHFEGTDVRFIIALNKHTGKTVWVTHRPEEPYENIPHIGKKAYVTPLLINAGGRDLLISNGSAVCNAYDPLTGEEVWSFVRGAESTVSMPFFENGILYFETGFMVDEDRSRFSELIALDPAGSGDITSKNLIWKKRIPRMPLATPVVKEGLIYTVNSNNFMVCIDGLTGEELWSHRLRAQVNSSPIYADGKIFFSSTRGETTVINAGRELEIISVNQLDGEIWATPAIIRNSLLIRTDENLYRISL